MANLLLLFFLAQIDPFGIEQEIVATPELLERLSRLEQNPININQATKQELLLIPCIDNHLAERIIEYRKRKLFKEKGELLLLNRITPIMLDRIRPYITVVRRLPKVRVPKDLELTSKFKRKIDDAENKIYNRFKMPVKGIYFGGLVEKDYEEDDYLDYYAGSFYLPQIFIVGDFDLDIGMGLIFGKPGFFYAGSGIIPGERGFSPHLSTYEEDYLRGVVGEWKNVMIFGSYIETSRFGREKLIGSSYGFYPFRLTGVVSNYDIEDRDRTALLSFYLDKELAGNLLRFEIATGGSNIDELKENIAYALGIDNGNGLKGIYARIPSGIPTFRNSPFGRNEEELYLHFEKRIIPTLSAIVYTEFNRDIAPLNDFTRQLGIQLNWKPIKRVSVNGRFKNNQGKDNFRFDIIYERSSLCIRNRFEVVNTNEGNGFLAYSGFRYSADYIFEMRFILYETDAWDSRIYEYENGLPGDFTIKQLSGSGKRIYLIVAEKFLPFKVYLKWGIDFKEEISHKIGMALTI